MLPPNTQQGFCSIGFTTFDELSISIFSFLEKNPFLIFCYLPAREPMSITRCQVTHFCFGTLRRMITRQDRKYLEMEFGNFVENALVSSCIFCYRLLL